MDRKVVDVSSLSLSVCLFLWLSTYLPTYLSMCPSISLSLALCLPACLSVYLSIYLSTCLSASLKTKLFCETSSGFELDIIKFCETPSDFELDNTRNAAILRDFLNVWTWQRPKTKQFCETSSFFKVDNIKNEAILRDFLQKWKVACSADGLVPMRFAIFPVHLSKLLRLPRKNDARSYEVLAPVTQNHLSKPEDLMLQNATPLRKSAPGPPNSSDEHATCLLYCACHGKCIFADPLQMSHACHRFGNATKPSRFAHFWQGAQSLAPATRNELWTSKSGPNVVCFVHVDFEMCFAPQRRALFRHLNFQKWSDTGVFCTLWLRNVLRATTACTFPTSQLPKVVRSWCALCILTWKCASRHNGMRFLDISTSKSAPNVRCFWLFTCKCASRHNGVQFFISHLASWLRTRRFSEPTFRPSGATNHWNNTVFRDFPTFSHTWIFFLLRLSLFVIFFLLLTSLLWLFPPLLFICPYCRKFDF